MSLWTGPAAGPCGRAAPGRSGGSWRLGRHPARPGGPAAAVLSTARGDAVTADRLPAFGPGPTAPPAGRRLLTRGPPRPSLAALLALLAVVVFFGLRAPDLLTARGLA